MSITRIGLDPGRHMSRLSGGGSMAQCVAAMMADSPWGLWEQTETSGSTLADSSGNSHDLTITGSPSLNQTGPSAGVGPASVAFASSASTECYAGTANTQTDSTSTITAWVNLAALPAALTPIICVANTYGGTTTSLNLYIDTTGTLTITSFDTVFRKILTGVPMPLGTWVHVVGSLGAAGLKIRVNKTTQASNPAFTSRVTTAQSIFVHGGPSATNPGNLTNGDALAVALPAYFSGQLSDARTDAHYNALVLV